MNRRLVNIADAVGKVLCHTVTGRVRGEPADLYLRKGHIITEDDVRRLRLLGREQVEAIEMDSHDLHEDNAAARLARAAAGRGLWLTSPVESKVNLIASHRGLLKINVRLLEQVNALPHIVIATLPTNTPVDEKEKTAGAKVIPLVVPEEVIIEAEAIMASGPPLVEIKPFLSKSVSLVAAGNESYYRKVKDYFLPLLAEKLQSFGSRIISSGFSGDCSDRIAQLITEQIGMGADIIMVTGGLSDDPEDTTPKGIVKAGAEIVQFGAPVLPGAMFLLGYIKDLPVLGIPACGTFYRTTILDLLLPRILAGEKITKTDVQGLGHGGLCRSCGTCSFRSCFFGLGGLS